MNILEIYTVHSQNMSLKKQCIAYLKFTKIVDLRCSHHRHTQTHRVMDIPEVHIILFVHDDSTKLEKRIHTYYLFFPQMFI